MCVSHHGREKPRADPQCDLFPHVSVESITKTWPSLSTVLKILVQATITSHLDR